MRLEDAPPAGWYPDPSGGSRLRWWEGTDWSDRYRAPPTPSETDRRELIRSRNADEEPDDDHHGMGSYERHITRVPGRPTGTSDEIVNQVREAAREEAERAATMFAQQARAATKNLTPLISEYTTKIMRWIKIATFLIVLVLILWIGFQIFAQVSLFEWIGDRIDNITDNIGNNDGG